MIYHHLRQILPDHPVIFEIGAHIGTDTCALVRMAKPSLYVAFEPDPRNLIKLYELKEYLDFELYPYGVSDRIGKATFWQSHGQAPGNQREHTDSSSLKEPIKPGRPWISFSQTEIETVTLDWFCEERSISHVDFIWMDVQGAELDVIRGGQRCLRNTDYLYTEYREGMPLYRGQPDLDAILGALPGSWEIKDRTKTDVLLRRMS
jgi:FkbM family methyltransferase